MSVIHPSQLQKKPTAVEFNDVPASQDRRSTGWNLYRPPAQCCACGKCDLCLNHGGYKLIETGIQPLRGFY